MKAEHAVALLKALGATDPQNNGVWVTCSCVLAPWNHKTGKDTTPSFGINLESGRFNCFTCSKGSLDTLFGEIQMHLSHTPALAPRYNLKLAREIIDGLVSEVDPLPEFTEFDPQGVSKFQEWPEYFIDQFSAPAKVPEAMAYLRSRGLDDATIDHFNLRVDQTHGRIVCPFRNVHGQLAGARGRAFLDSVTLKHFDYSWNHVKNSGLVLYHEDVLRLAEDHGRSVLVVEGQFDTMAMWPHYPYVVGNLTAKPTPAKLSRLRNCSHVVILLDNDKTGEESRDAWVRGLRDHTRVEILPYPDEIRLNPEFKDPGSLSIEHRQAIADLLKA